jgi:lipopolysaccharide/colanic/teichoic acid biosynthesis glycosyltransferase
MVTMGRPILFIQERVGLKERTLKLYKFRSMTNVKNSDGVLLPNNERVTKLGKFIRKSSIDELPSLLNVLKGDLSLVGPRPLLVEYLPCYKPVHRIRHTVRPGITGLAQINGRNVTTWQSRLDFDKHYVENQSLYLDFKILLLTVYKVFKRENVEGGTDLSISRLDRDSSYLEN